MPKVMTSVRLDSSVMQKLTAYNEVRLRYGFQKISVAQCVEECVDLYIETDRQRIAGLADRMRKDFAEE